MSTDELVSKLRKAGINASLIHRIHDETMINMQDTVEDMRRVFQIAMEGSGVGFDVSALKPAPMLPASEEFTGFRVGESSSDHYVSHRIPIAPMYVDYIKPTGGGLHHVSYRELEKRILALSQVPEELLSKQEGSKGNLATKYGSIETISGAKRSFSKRDMGDNM